MVLAEAAQIEIDLVQASLCGSPYPDLAGYDFPTYLAKAHGEVAAARYATRHDWPKGPLRRIGHALGDILRVWTGSEHETAMAALHRAGGLLLMVAPDSKLQSEALKIEANFKSTSDIPASDPRRSAYPAVFARIKGWSASSPRDPATEVGDRVMLREIRREQNEEWEIARCKVRIFRNILSVTIPIVAGILIVAAVIAWANPGLISLRGSTATPAATDVAVVEFLGGLGGLLSAVATLTAARNFERFYGLPLAQSILKLPAGAASALVGILLVQHGLLGSIGPLSWDTVLAYALVFGVAQVAVTKQIDSRAGDLLGDANAKSPISTPPNTDSRSRFGE
jgi:hypothetical protein